jgi:hypothetical protein
MDTYICRKPIHENNKCQFLASKYFGEGKSRRARGNAKLGSSCAGNFFKVI